MQRRAILCAAIVVALFASLGSTPATTHAQTIPICSPGGPDVVFDGAVTAAEAKTYIVSPVDVQTGTTRIELEYSWADIQPAPPSTPLTQTVFDLGLWDNDGYRAVDGFRGWSGSRQGRVSKGQDPIWVQADSAERGYRPGPVEPGIWYPEVGVAAVGPSGATWQVVMRCLNPTVGSPFSSSRVDASHVAPGTTADWYHGDFHMHGVHSHSNAPEWDDGDSTDVDSFVDFARAAGLDFTPVTDYVTTQHWEELGPVQVANPDLLLWPSREIITYFGHATVFGESDSVNDYRHGFEDITLGDIQRATKADGALFGVAHPTIFPGPLFSNFCRGCEFELVDEIDWSLVDTIEVLTGPILVDQGDLGAPGPAPTQIQNPFVDSAIDLWESKLLEGHRVTAVSGSDDKLGPGLGSSATAVFADELSRAAVTRGLIAGRAFVKTKGVAASPHVTVTVTASDGSSGTVGDRLDAESALVSVHVSGAADQLLRVSVDGEISSLAPIAGDDATITFSVSQSSSSGPLGTFVRVDTLDAQSLTTIGNPFYLGGADEGAPVAPDPVGGPAAAPTATDDAQPLPATGGRPLSSRVALVLIGLALATRAGSRRLIGS